MSEEGASAFVERRAFEAALVETEMHRAANVALESQLGQAHEATLLAQADAETLAVAVRAWASTHQPMECEECEDLVTLARTAHPGTPLADEVRAARAAIQAAHGVAVALQAGIARDGYCPICHQTESVTLQTGYYTHHDGCALEALEAALKAGVK